MSNELQTHWVDLGKLGNVHLEEYIKWDQSYINSEHLQYGSRFSSDLETNLLEPRSCKSLDYFCFGNDIIGNIWLSLVPLKVNKSQ